MKCNGLRLGIATGFFWKYADKTYLVTNWHVVSGRNPISHIAMNEDLAVPDEMSFPVYISANDFENVEYKSVCLYDVNCDPAWIEHKEFGSSIDIAAIELPFFPNLSDPSFLGKVIYPIKSGGYVDRNLLINLPRWCAPRIEMGEDLYILGFPFGIMPTRHFPIWKHASIASEMDVMLDDKPSFLVDTTTKPGMSGSPVIQKIRKFQLDQSNNIVESASIAFVGIYSGRRKSESEVEAKFSRSKFGDDTNLGVVWREELIWEILFDAQRGKINIK